MITYGSHNSLTYAKLIWWQRPFAWVINPFCRCQDKDIVTQWRRCVMVFDFQIAKYRGKWMASHGIAWYDAGSLQGILKSLNDHAQLVGEYLYVAIGIDTRLFQSRKKREKLYDEMLSELPILQKLYPNIIFYKLYHDKTEYYAVNKFFFERYWSLAWAKQKIKKERGLLRWLLLLPLPRLWSHFYKTEWKQEATDRNLETIITDFVV